MKTITIITPANIELEYRLAGVGSRLAAFIVDFAIQAAAVLLAAWVIIAGIDRHIFSPRTAAPSGAALGAVMIVAFIIHFGYFIVLELTMNGQTVGKRMFGLRVIRDNGQPVGFAQALVRGLVRSSIDMMYVGLFVILFSAKHKRLGDMAAGTVVVSESYGAREPSLALPEWPDFLPDPLAISPEERRLVEDWLRRRPSLPDYGAGIGRKLEEYFKTVSTEATKPL